MEPSGTGWELFRNYLIAKEKYKPDYFLYENNRSMSKAIREKITEELRVEPIPINSALVSAQNRRRLYWTNIPGVGQPEDRGILLRNILETETAYRNGTRRLTAAFAMRQVGRRINERGHRDDYNTELEHIQRYEVNENPGKTNCLTTVQKDNMVAIPIAADSLAMLTPETRRKRVYEVRGARIEINGKIHPIGLPDGLYLIRNLTLRECARLQTVPESYRFPVSDSRAKAILGNGWTVAVIAHILSHCPGIRTEPLEVLSMYDGMSCGRLALNNLGANVVRYYATEIDRYAIATTQANFPDAVQLGDAFQVRNPGWNPRNAA